MQVIVFNYQLQSESAFSQPIPSLTQPIPSIFYFICKTQQREAKSAEFGNIKSIIQCMPFRKSNEELSFLQLSNSSPKQPQPKQEEPAFETYHPRSSYIILKYYSRFIELSKVYCVGLLTQIFLTILYYEVDYLGYASHANLLIRALFINCVFSTGINLLVILSHNQWRTAEGKGLKSFGIRHALFTTAMIFLQPYEFLENIYLENWNYATRSYAPYKLNYLLTVFSLFKFGIVIYMLIFYRKFKNYKSSILWSKHGPIHPYLFVIKHLFKQHSIALISTLFVFSLFFFSFAYRVSQRSKYIQPNLFEYFENCLWMVFITMTSVGYGDCTPVTIIGRSFGLLCTFYGIFVVSITVLLVINTFEMDCVETETLEIIKRLKQQRKIKETAGEYIRLTLWRLWLNKKLRRNNLGVLAVPESRQEKTKKNTLHDLINTSKYKNMNEKSIGVEMARQFEQITSYTQSLNHNFDSVLNFLTFEKSLNVISIAT